MRDLLHFPGEPAPVVPQTLVVGDIVDWQRQGRILPRLRGCEFLGLPEVTADRLAGVELVLSPLVAHHFDVLDLALHLGILGFGGMYRALAVALPRPSMVRAEVAAVAPRVDFDVFVIESYCARPGAPAKSPADSAAAICAMPERKRLALAR
ncbi:MAG: hypothetical protein IT542_01260 [Rubellimicrobium sp.]|nr:hypothetical protein [Rubellimicrobium sp.]